MCDEDSLREMVREFYQTLFTKEDGVEQRRRLQGNFPIIEHGQLDLLAGPVKDDEIQIALFGMKPYKAPGPDGYQPFFFQSQLQVIGPTVCRYIRGIFEGDSKLADISHSHQV